MQVGVIVFAQEPALQMSPRRLKFLRPDIDGAFDAGTLPPGKYFACVVAEPHRFRRVDQAVLNELTSSSVALDLKLGRTSYSNCGTTARWCLPKPYQITLTAPDSRIAVSRVTRGNCKSRATATISVSKGSRVKRSSSACITCACVRSSG